MIGICYICHFVMFVKIVIFGEHSQFFPGGSDWKNAHSHDWNTHSQNRNTHRCGVEPHRPMSDGAHTHTHSVCNTLVD